MLVERGLAETQTRARALVMAGAVFSGEVRLEKPGMRVDPEAAIEVRGADHPWASRGGLKLAHGLDHFAIDPAGATALDIGASTGGFTDVLLSRGAARVYAVDVGRGQLAWTLRQDQRVVGMEGINARTLTAAEIPEPIDLIVCDASFIGLEVVLANPLTLAAPGANLVVLIKPQFEVGPKRVGKGGIVRDPALQAQVCERIEAWLGANGWTVAGVTESPIRGAKGNKEFLVAAKLGR